jgi:hypothetical protein
MVANTALALRWLPMPKGKHTLHVQGGEYDATRMSRALAGRIILTTGE